MRLALGAVALVVATSVFAKPLPPTKGRWFAPPNNLYLQDQLHLTNARFTEADFNRIIDEVITTYAPVGQGHGVTISAVPLWNDPTVNAFAEQDGTAWRVHMFGGLARRPEATQDGFALVVCHELGHHLGGYPFSDDAEWAADEGQADYFATLACARRLWGQRTAENEALRAHAPLAVRTACNASTDDRAAQNLCYRTVLGGQSLANLLATLEGSKEPSLSTPDTSELEDTNHEHPAAQCRFDTFVAGALCNASFAADVIPGRGNRDGQASLGAEAAAAAHSCMRSNGDAVGQRPSCWFAPKMAVKLVPTSVVIEEKSGNGNQVVEPGETVTVKASLLNSNPFPVGGAVASIDTPPANVTVVTPSVDYGLLASGGTTASDTAFSLMISPDAPCGSVITVPVTTRSEAGRDQGHFAIRLGRQMPGTAVAGPGQAAIPDDGKTPPLMQSVQINELAAASATVVVTLDHPAPEELLLAMIDPSGHQAYMLSTGGRSAAHNGENTFTFDLKRGSTAGKWQLFVEDVSPGNAGRLVSWSMNVAHAVCEKA